jgi:transposase
LCLEERVSVSKNRRSFTPEFKEEAAKMVVEATRPVASVARELQLMSRLSVTG